MKELYPQLSIELLCGLFGYTRQHYYKVNKRGKLQRSYENQVLDIVREVRKDQHRIGTVKLQLLINQRLKESPIGRDRLYELLRSKKLLIRRKKKYRPKQTDGNGESLYPDLRKGFNPIKVKQLWCGDITYIELNTSQKHCYLMCITDEYSHLIVGFHISLRMRTEDILLAMKMAVSTQLESGKSDFENKLIFHTDRGSQFKSKLFQKFINRFKIRSSMTAAGKSYENPVAERLNGILKNELLTQDIFDSFEQASAAIKKAIKVYNEQRPHLSCNLLTPKQAHEQNYGPLKKLWKQRKGKKRREKT